MMNTGCSGRRLSGSRLRRALLAAGLACAAALPAPGTAAPAASAPARVTILDGSATLLDGIRRSAAAPGLALADGTIVETAPGTRLLRIEWPDGAALNLGPDTRAMWNPPGFARRGGGPALYLLQGWAKYSGPPKARAPGLVTPLFELAPFAGIVVAHVDAQRTTLFVQAGAAVLTERQIKPAVRHELAAGQFYARGGPAAGTVQARASSTDLQHVPRAFRDTLPSRYVQAAAAVPEPEALPAPGYAELQAWLSAELPVRRGFTRRFARLLRDRDFRRELDAHLSDHAEWRRILYPPPPPPPPSAPSAAGPIR